MVNTENPLFKAPPVKRLESVCESIISGLVAEGAAVLLEKIGVNAVRIVIGLSVLRELLFVDVELNWRPVPNSGVLYVTVMFVRLMIPKPKRSPTWIRMLASRLLVGGNVSTIGSGPAATVEWFCVRPKPRKRESVAIRSCILKDNRF
jgi:hypothetical protein